jgi:hypothetical protein
MVCYSCNNILAAGQPVHRRQVQTSSRTYVGQRSVSTGAGFSVKPFCYRCAEVYDKQVAEANAAAVKAGIIIFGLLMAVIFGSIALAMHK